VKTLRDLDVDGKRVLVRVDFNVPLADGRITDDSRIRAALPTIEALRERGARLILVSHLGRPRDREPSLSLRPVADRLADLIKARVELAPAVVGPEVEALADRLAPGDILMLENVRFEPGETHNDEQLALSLAKLADVYVNDAFGAAHRAHASTEGVAHHMKHVAAGLLLEREVTQLEAIIADPARPLVAILGGNKVTDKIGVIDRFVTLADTLAIGGAMCFPFLRAEGHAVGSSLCEAEGIQPARHALEAAAASDCELLLPDDLVIGDRLAADASRRELDGVEVPDGWLGGDIGPRSAARYAERIAAARTVFWNGPMGAFELPGFETGTRVVAEAVAKTAALTVVGGGDSVAALVNFGLAGSVDHLSTGGGASLELIEGHMLPGVEVLA
jgi:phosphoglycerate kinase